MIIKYVEVRKKTQLCFIFSHDEYNDIVYFALMFGNRSVMLDAISSYFSG